MALRRDPTTGHALVGGLSLATLLDDERVATPCYVYDVDAIVASAQALSAGFGSHDHLICYAVKANPAGRIVRRLAEVGVGADVVSGGELDLALRSGVPAGRIVYSGVAKTDREIDAAIGAGDRGILSMHVESVEELARVAARARALGRRARVSLRVNPSVEVDTHAHIATGHDEAKFGVPIAEIGDAIDLALAERHVDLVGLSAHVGSQLCELGPYVDGVRVLCDLARRVLARGRSLELLDAGGGFGIDYGTGCPVEPADFARAAASLVTSSGLPPLRLLCEPGRSLVAAHGTLLARVVQIKRWRRPDTMGWVLLDAGMNDLLRPALYAAHHRVEPLVTPPVGAPHLARWRVAGPVCESSDDFGTHDLPDPPGDAVVVRDAGAYGFAMASQYNARAMPCEVFVEGGRVASVSTWGGVEAWLAGRVAT